MKGISLWQPWASLIALGKKRVETRSWRPPQALVGQRIAIHASARPVDQLARELLFRAGVDPGMDLPRGAIVATARLWGVWKSSREPIQGIVPPRGMSFLAEVLTSERHRDLPTDDLELALGDWSPGRCFWALDEVRPMDPVPCRGMQGLWAVPAELAGMLP